MLQKKKKKKNKKKENIDKMTRTASLFGGQVFSVGQWLPNTHNVQFKCSLKEKCDMERQVIYSRDELDGVLVSLSVDLTGELVVMELTVDWRAGIL